jgi:hypothetical protein
MSPLLSTKTLSPIYQITRRSLQQLVDAVLSRMRGCNNAQQTFLNYKEQDIFRVEKTL